MPEPSPAAEMAPHWGRAVEAARKLTAALDAIQGAGGLGKLSRTWTPAAQARAAATLLACSRSIAGALAYLPEPPRDGGRPKRPKRPAPSAADPGDPAPDDLEELPDPPPVALQAAVRRSLRRKPR